MHLRGDNVERCYRLQEALQMDIHTFQKHVGTMQATPLVRLNWMLLRVSKIPMEPLRLGIQKYHLKHWELPRQVLTEDFGRDSCYLKLVRRSKIAK